MWLLPDIYGSVLTELDRLEGYDPAADDSLYDRIQVTVTTAAGQDVEAWLYEAGERAQRRFKAYATPVPSGDFVDVRRPTETTVPA